MFLTTNPWDYMGTTDIEMGKFTGTGVALYQFVQTATLYIGIIAITASVIAIIVTNKAEGIQNAKNNIQFKLGIIFLVGVASFLLSALMTFCNQLFGLS